MKFLVRVMPKADVLDPQGEAVGKALRKLAFSSLTSVRVGKSIEIDIQEPDARLAEAKVKTMADKLLCNANVETYSIQAL